MLLLCVKTEHQTYSELSSYIAFSSIFLTFVCLLPSNCIGSRGNERKPTSISSNELYPPKFLKVVRCLFCAKLLFFFVHETKKKIYLSINFANVPSCGIKVAVGTPNYMRESCGTHSIILFFMLRLHMRTVTLCGAKNFV